ncbi:hypothetical protein B0H14DRAFT_3867028 [Mycena olivaceomarginata]|nr:hypothetical protein B0H14DRAFT_3867028 [Mycena olivaceomarginata]
MSDDSFHPKSDDTSHYSPAISQHHWWEEKARREEQERDETQDPGSSPCRFRGSAVVARGLNEEYFEPGGVLDSQVGSLAWANALGNSTPEAPSTPARLTGNKFRNPASPVKTEDVDFALLRLRCADLEAERERMAEEITTLYAQLEEARSHVTEWKLLAQTASGSIRRAAQLLADAGEVLLV